MIQPPGGAGVQGLRYSKLIPHMLDSDWEFHFAGPSPQLTSITVEPLACPTAQCHYTDNVSHSARFAILKHRHRKHSPPYYLYGALQLVTRQIERLITHDSFEFLRRGIIDASRRADDVFDFDLIAALSPDFRLMEAGARLAKERGNRCWLFTMIPTGKETRKAFTQTTASVRLTF